MSTRFAVVLSLLSVLTVSGQEVNAVDSLQYQPSSKAAAQKAARSNRLSFELAARAPKSLQLATISHEEWNALPTRSGATLMGVERNVEETLVQAGEWTSLADGRMIWRTSAHSAGAAALRVQFSSFNVLNGSVWIYGAAHDQVFGPFSGAGLDASGSFWSNTVFGDTLVVEYQPETSTQSVPFSIARVAQIQNTNQTVASTGPGASAACQIDVNCFATLNPSGVGQMIIQSNGGSYLCTGSLLNNSNRDFKPFFLTANHCVANAAEARSLEVYWNFQTRSCNGETFGLASSPRTLGATYLVSRDLTQGDFSLLLLNALPAINLTFYGWNGAADALALGSKTTAIHHPRGDYTKISFGLRAADQNVSVAGTIAPANLYFRILNTQGRIEPGSSGSALFNAAGQVVGIASHAPGGDACAVDPFVAGYGRLSAAIDLMKPYLNPVASRSIGLGAIMDGNGWTSVIHLVNSSNAAVTVEISFTDNAGAALAMPIRNALAASTLTFTIPASSSAAIQTAGVSKTYTVGFGTLKVLDGTHLANNVSFQKLS